MQFSADPRQLFQQAIRAFQSNNPDEAERLCRQCNQIAPTFPDAHHMLGVILGQTGRAAEAVQVLRQASKLSPNDVPLRVNLGEACRRAGLYDEAILALKEAVRANPNLHQALYNLALSLEAVDRREEAIRIYRELQRQAPNQAEPLFNLGTALYNHGLVKEALTHLEQAVKIQPSHGKAWINYANALNDMNHSVQSINAYNQALTIDPLNHSLHDSLGNVYTRAGHIQQAKASYRKALASRQNQWLGELKIQGLFHAIAPSQEEVETYQAGLLSHLQELLTAEAGATLKLDESELAISAAEPPLILTYQAGLEPQIKQAYGELFSKLIKPVTLQPHGQPGSRPRVGIVVTNGHEGVFLKCMGRTIVSLTDGQTPTRCHITLICSTVGRNIFCSKLPQAKVDYFLLDGKDIAQHAKKIAAAKFDVLHYWEIGTDSTNYFLPFYKPARVQVSSWGWPSSAMHDRVNWYQSSAWIEPPDAQTLYTEKLWTPDVIPTDYEFPPAPGEVTRAQTGLPEGRRVYLCAQNLRKYQAEFDVVLKQILQQDTQAVVAILEDTQPGLTAALLARFTRSGLPMDRVITVKRSDYTGFIRLLASADVVLDTPGYGGGANTVLDTLFTGTPLITVNGAHQRGRWSAAVLSHAGLGELIAPDVPSMAALAVSIGQDPERCRILRARASEASKTMLQCPDITQSLDNWWASLANDPG